MPISRRSIDDGKAEVEESKEEMDATVEDAGGSSEANAVEAMTLRGKR